MQFHITADDEAYLDFSIYYQLNAKGLKNNILLLKWGVPVITIIVVAVVSYFSVGFGLPFCIGISFVLIYLIIYIVRFESSMRKKLKKALENFKKDGRLPYEKEVDVKFAENEMIYNSENVLRKVPYSDVQYVWKDEKHIYIVFAAMLGVILPLRCLDGKENEIISFIEEKRKGKIENSEQ